MLTSTPHPEVVRFGPFEADLVTQELRKFGTKVRLPNQSFLVLAVLLERQGQLVTREELRKLLWPSDTFVEYDQGLNAAVNRLRDALGDSSDKPRFIETLPKRGYRFIAVAQEISTPRRPTTQSNGAGAAAESTPGSATDGKCEDGVGVLHRAIENESTAAIVHLGRSKLAVMSAALLAVLVLAFVSIRSIRRWNERGLARMRVIPFTSFPGQEVAPSFSPDGSQIAFAWKREEDKGFDLYIKAIGSEHTVRLTNHPSRWISPAWSPDGTQIAFSRFSDEGSGIFVVPVLGGAERKLVDTTFWFEPFTQISWSPDAKMLAFRSASEGHANVSLLALDTLNARILTPGIDCWDVGAPAISPDGRSVAFICTSSLAVYRIFVAPLALGSPRLLATMMGYPLGLTWSADGTRIVFSNDSGEGGELWQANLNGNLTRLMFGDQGSGPAVAPRGNRLAYARGWKTEDIWRVDLVAPNPEASLKKLISSTRIQRVPQYSPDGTRIVFESNRSGSHEIWLADADGGNPTQMTFLNGAQTGSPSWCSDGERIAFDSRASGLSAIYIERIRDRVPHQVQTDVKNLAIPTWTEDCRWLFASDGQDFLYRLPSQGGNAVRVTNRPSWFSLVKGDKLFFNVKESTGVQLWSKPLGPGEEKPLKGMPPLAYIESWTVTSRGVYYTDSISSPPTINFYDFTSGSAKTVSRLRRRPTPDDGLAVSPDGRWLLYTQIDDEQSDIMLAEFFQ